MLNLTNKHLEFFDMLHQHAKYFNEGALILQKVLQDLPTAPERTKEMKAIEHKADELTLDTQRRLNQIFITPIDREDLLVLSEEVDNGVDHVYGVIERISIYDASSIDSTGPSHMAELILSASSEIIKAAEYMKSIKSNQARLIECAHRIDAFESEGDEVYRLEVSKIFKSDLDTLTIVKWRDIMQSLEETLDQAKHIGNLIKGVEMKYA